MGNWSQDYDNSQDCSYWNRRLRKAIATYQTATNEENFEEKRMLTLVILKLFEESHEYELDGFRLSDEQYEMATQVRDIVTGKWNPTYPSSQDDWNRELTDALQEGNMIQILQLVKSGKRLSFLRKIAQPFSEHLDTVKQITERISENIERVGR